MRNVTGAIAGVALIFGFVTRIVTLTRLLEFTPDQTRDGLRILAMWSGRLPTLGQEATPVWLGPGHGGEAGFAIPPLAYYAVFPFTALGPDPCWQVVPNALCSFLTIPLVMLLAYRLLDSVAEERRRLYAALAGLWWSASFADIMLNNKEWNPSPIPFFFFALVLLYAAAVGRTVSARRRAAIWIAYGATAAYCASLHGSTLAIVPVVSMASIVVYCVRERATPRRWWYPGLAVVTALLVATPYWAGETQRGWANTRAILAVATTHSADAPRLSLTQRVKNVALSYVGLGSQAYFIRSSHAWRVGLPFLVIVLGGFACFRGSRTIWWYLCATWLLFAFAAANAGPAGAQFLHYKLLIVVAPLLLGFVILADHRSKARWARGVRLFVAVSLVISLLFNLRTDVSFLAEKFGPRRVMSTSELTAALARLPRGATLCVNAEATWTQALYIDRLQTRRALRFATDCRGGTFVIRPHYVGRALGDLTDFGQDALDYQSVANPESTAGLVRIAATQTYDVLRVRTGRRYTLVQGIAQVPAVTVACFARVTAERPPSPLIVPPISETTTLQRNDVGTVAAAILDELDFTCF